MAVWDVQRLKVLAAEKAKPKRLLAESMLDTVAVSPPANGCIWPETACWNHIANRSYFENVASISKSHTRRPISEWQHFAI
jgi:hypothetical protein